MAQELGSGRWTGQTSVPSRGWNVLQLSYLKKPHDIFAVIVYVSFGLLVFGLLVAMIWAMGMTFASLINGGTSDSEKVRFFIYLLAALITGPLLIWAAVIRQSNLNITRRAHVAEVFQKASESLAVQIERTEESSSRAKLHPKIITKSTSRSAEARIAAIYALERIGRVSADDHSAAHDLLAAFVHSQPAGPDWELALRTIAKRFDGLTTPVARVPVNLNKTDFRQKGAQQFTFVNADLQDAVFLNLRCSEFVAIECDFTRAIFAKIVVKAKAGSIAFSNCDLESALFIGASMQNAIFDQSTILASSDFTGADLSSVVFKDCDLENTKFNFANLDGAKFVGCKITSAHFENCRMIGTRFRDCTVNSSGVKFDKALRSSTSIFPENADLSQVIDVTDDGTTSAEDFEKWNEGRQYAIGEQLAEHEHLMRLLKTSKTV